MKGAGTVPAMSTMHLPAVADHAETLLSARDRIIGRWLGYKAVRDTFERHQISTEHFRQQFAGAIFDYYIGVIKGEKEIGDCPIMGAYLEFLSRKYVSPDELFTVCTHFRKALTAYAFEAQIASAEVVEGLSEIADRNIQGLLQRFHALYRKDEASLRQQRESLLEAQKIAHIGHWELDLRSGHLYWSDEVYRIFGIEPEIFEATYDAFLQRIHPDDVEMVNTAYNGSVRNRTSYHIVHRVLTVHNVLKYVEERCFHHFDKEGNVYRSIGTVHDITEQVKAQQELQLSSKLFEHSNDAVVITDENNRIVMVNNAFTKMTGYNAPEVKGNNPRLFSAGWGDDAFYKQMWADIIGKGVWQGEVWDRKKSGEAYAAQLTILSVKDDEGKVINYIGISKDVTAHREQEEQITQLAYYDTLTRLPNRVLFKKKVDAAIQTARYDHTRFALFFMDIDDFKWLNDSLGHAMGNRALVEITRRIQNVLDQHAILCRIGGDEFALFCPYQNLLEVSYLARRIIEIIKKQPIQLDNKFITLGMSIGISLFPENGRDFATLVQSADTAMNQAKENGKNHFVYFNQEMNTNAVRRLEIDTRLRLAIGNGSFSMVYQPKVCLATKKVYGLEALLRWNDPELGFVPPDHFIPIAEESKLIEEIGYWVIERSLEEFCAILAVDAGLVVSINVSSKQFNDRKFVKRVSGLIKASQVPAENIEFEITETAIMENIDVIAQTLEAIKALGVHISIDDFGTGYSSMAYLKKLPIHTIKIDRTFVEEIDSDEDDKAITEAIVAMSRRLHLSTIAEGIETEAHEAILREMGVDNGQGYLYSKPLPLQEFIAFIEK